MESLLRFDETVFVRRMPGADSLPVIHQSNQFLLFILLIIILISLTHVYMRRYSKRIWESIHNIHPIRSLNWLDKSTAITLQSFPSTYCSNSDRDARSARSRYGDIIDTSWLIVQTTLLSFKYLAKSLMYNVFPPVLKEVKMATAWEFFSNAYLCSFQTCWLYACKYHSSSGPLPSHSEYGRKVSYSDEF